MKLYIKPIYAKLEILSRLRNFQPTTNFKTQYAFCQQVRKGQLHSFSTISQLFSIVHLSKPSQNKQYHITQRT